MKVGVAGAALIAALVALALLVWGGFAVPLWGGPSSDVDWLEDRFAHGCGPDGTDRETPDPNSRASWWGGNRQNGARFLRHVERTEPEITYIACKYSGPALRYFEFANHDEALNAGSVYRDDQRVCVLDDAVFDIVGSAAGVTPSFCERLNGRLM